MGDGSSLSQRLKQQKTKAEIEQNDVRQDKRDDSITNKFARIKINAELKKCKKPNKSEKHLKIVGCALSFIKMRVSSTQ